MRIKEVKLYQFNELSAEAKERARDRYRTANIDDPFWSENVIDDAKEQLKLLGFEVDEIYWSGFWSQGDGACFTGTWEAKNVNAEQLAKDCPAEAGESNKKLNDLAIELADIAKRFPEASAILKHGGRYCHEQSVDIECKGFEKERETEQGDVPVWSSTDAANFQDSARDCMRWIYKSLETEYEYANADEQVDEMLVVNEYEFTEDGRVEK